VHRVDVIEQSPSAGPDPAALGDPATDADVVRQAVERHLEINSDAERP
jgi:hypothetical protein